MHEEKGLSLRIAEFIGGLLLSVLLGAVGGGLCGGVILFFNAFIGRSGTTGAEYFGYWNPWAFLIGLMYGVPIGGIVTPLAYPLLVRRIGFGKAVLPATVGTLAGGFLGALVGPGYAVLSGIVGFVVALLWARLKPTTMAVGSTH